MAKPNLSSVAITIAVLLNRADTLVAVLHDDAGCIHVVHFDSWRSVENWLAWYLDRGARVVRVELAVRGY